MYSVTDAFNTACAAPGREITSKIKFNGTNELPGSEVQEISVTEQFGSSDGVTIGASFSSQCKVVIYKESAPALSGGNFIPYVGASVDGTVKRKPVRKVQYIVAIKRYNTVFIGIFLAKMLRYTAPYRLGYYQITITFRAIFTHCDTCFGSSLHPLPCRFASRADNHR